jgi:hypothetical protein
MKPLAVVLLAAASLSGAQAPDVFTGVITDSECAEAGHARMRMGPTDAECVTACIQAHAAQYVLFDGKSVYLLSDQKLPERFAAQKVAVTGTLDAAAKRIQVQSMAAAK